MAHYIVLLRSFFFCSLLLFIPYFFGQRGPFSLKHVDFRIPLPGKFALTMSSKVTSILGKKERESGAIYVTYAPGSVIKDPLLV